MNVATIAGLLRDWAPLDAQAGANLATAGH